MAQIYPLEAPESTRHGGFLVIFPSGLRKTVQWRREGPVIDSLGVAKHLAAKLLGDLMNESRSDEANFTNWTSMTAAIQKIVKDWSEKRKADLYALDSSPALVLHS